MIKIHNGVQVLSERRDKPYLPMRQVGEADHLVKDGGQRALLNEYFICLERNGMAVYAGGAALASRIFPANGHPENVELLAVGTPEDVRRLIQGRGGRSVPEYTRLGFSPVIRADAESPSGEAYDLSGPTFGKAYKNSWGSPEISLELITEEYARTHQSSPASQGGIAIIRPERATPILPLTYSHQRDYLIDNKETKKLLRMVTEDFFLFGCDVYFGGALLDRHLFPGIKKTAALDLVVAVEGDTVKPAKAYFDKYDTPDEKLFIREFKQETAASDAAEENRVVVPIIATMTRKNRWDRPAQFGYNLGISFVTKGEFARLANLHTPAPEGND